MSFGLMIVTLKNALLLMEKTENGKAVPFDIEYCSFSKSRGTGGEIVKLTGVTLNRNIEEKQAGPSVQSKQAVRQGRQPAHFQNKTRNVSLPNGLTRKFHIRMLLKINGITVVY